MKYHVRIAVIAILGLLLITGAVLKVKADEPITVITVITVVAGIATIVGTLWSIFGTHTPEVRTTTSVSTQSPDGTITTVTTTTTSDAPATITVPTDFPSLTIPPGYTMGEVTSFQGRTDKRVEIDYQDINYGADVTNPAFGPGRSVQYDTKRTSTFSFLPPSSPSQTSVANLTLSISGLSLSTTNLPRTDGSSSYNWNVQSPQLGTIFNSSARVPQGGLPVISGDIPASAFTMSYGSATLSYSKTISVNVPAGLAFVNFTAYLETGGLGSMAPPPRVGGVTTPVNKLGLLAPYIGLVSAILAAAVASAFYVKRVERRKEKQ